MLKKILLFLLLIINLWTNEFDFRNVNIKDIYFSPYKEEGYLQGWNFFFRNSEYNIICNFIISNLGPFDLNSGVSITIESLKTGSVFITKEFAEKDLITSNSPFKIQIFNNSLEKDKNIFKVKQFFNSIKLYLEFSSDEKGVTLSGGKYLINTKDKFVKADIPFSFTKVNGYLDYKGEIIPLEGVGGMEHLLTNYEVYKFSSEWEILRAVSSDGMKLFTGGFHGKNKNSNDSFRTIIVQNKSGENILSGRIQKSEIKKSSIETYSGYSVIDLEKIYLSDNCTIEIERGAVISRNNILAHISAVLRFFVKLFFTNPYQLNFSSKVNVDCPNIKNKFEGIHTYYMINSK